MKEHYKIIDSEAHERIIVIMSFTTKEGHWENIMIEMYMVGESKCHLPQNIRCYGLFGG